MSVYDNANVRLFNYLNKRLFSHEYWIMMNYGKTKKSSDENQRVDWIKSIHWYRLVNIGWLADTGSPWEDLVNKNSNFADFVRFRPHTYTRTQQFLPPLWAAINVLNLCTDRILAAAYTSSRRRCSVRKGVLRNFAKFTGKHLCLC